MRTRALIREIWLDTVTGTSRSLLNFSILFVAIVCLTLSDAIVMNQVVVAARAFHSSGAATFTVAAAGQINGEACERLNGLPGIESAGAIKTTPTKLTLQLLPDAPLDEYTTTLSLPRVFGAVPSSTDGLFVPSDVLDALGRPGANGIDTDRGTADVAGVYSYPADGRRAGFAWAALNPVRTDEAFDECWVATWPASSDIRPLLLTTLRLDGGGNASTSFSQLNTRLGETLDMSKALDERPTKLAPVIALLLGIALGAVNIRLRRLELAARAHDGARRSDLQLTMIGECAIWSVPVIALAAIPVTVLSATGTGADAAAITMSALGGAALGVIGALIGTLASTATVRADHLFRYHKDR